MNVKQILIQFFNEKKVNPPLTKTKIERAGHNTTSFLLELKERLLKASDAKSKKGILDDYFTACERLL